MQKGDPSSTRSGFRAKDGNLPQAAQGTEEAMAVRVVPVVSFLILLLLPLKSCLPLEWTQPGLPRFTPISGANWGQWLSRWEWEEKPSVPSASPAVEPLPGQRPLQLCKPPGATSVPRQQRAQRSSKRRDGRPNSLDLTFHLLREFLEMSREERLAQKARSNKILLHNIGK